MQGSFADSLNYMTLLPALNVVIRRVCFLVVCGCGLLGCAHQRMETSPDKQVRPDNSSVHPDDEATDSGRRVAQLAQNLIGVPYRYGGSSPSEGFDCSGLVRYVYFHAVHLDLPRTARQLAAMPVKHVSKSSLSPGDLIFFGRFHHVTHIGIYIGDQRFVHAPSRRGAVRIGHLDESYWAAHYSGAKRPLTRYD